MSETSVPIIFLTGHGDIPLAVRAMEAGATGFLEKPFVANDLLERVEVALRRDREQRQSLAEFGATQKCLAALTPREREVLALVVAAKSSKEIAACLEISFRTVQNHRLRILRKMEAETTLDMVRKVMAAEGRTP